MLIQLVVTPVTAIMDTPEMALCVQVSGCIINCNCIIVSFPLQISMSAS